MKPIKTETASRAIPLVGLTILLGLVVTLAALPECLAGEKDGAAEAKPASPAPTPRGLRKSRPTVAASLKEIQFSFKLDPRLTRGLYMGDRWVSPPTYTRVGEGKQCLVEVRAYGLTTRQQPVEINAQWRTADADAVTVAPGPQHVATLTIKRPCQTIVSVTCNGLCRKLAIKAVPHADTLLVEITSPQTAAEIPKSDVQIPEEPQSPKPKPTV